MAAQSELLIQSKMASLNQDQIKILEQSRQRLVQLTRSLASLIGSLNQSDPLPSWLHPPQLKQPHPRAKFAN